jgi:hypothetical protein
MLCVASEKTVLAWFLPFERSINGDSWVLPSPFCPKRLDVRTVFNYQIAIKDKRFAQI